jgi:hypothetical protein
MPRSATISKVEARRVPLEALSSLPRAASVTVVV